jgi:hypothetical protein
MALDPRDFEAPLQLAITFAQMNRPDDAVATACKAIDLARSANQMSAAKLIEAWLKDYELHRPRARSDPLGR